MEISIISLLGLLVTSFAIWYGLTSFVTPFIKYNYDRPQKITAGILVIVSELLLWLPLLDKSLTGAQFIHHGLIALVFIVLIEIAFIDFKYLEIPDSYNLSLLIFSLLFGANYFFNLMTDVFSISNNYMLGAILSGVLCFFFYYAIHITTRSLGGGDVKMSLGLGILASLVALVGYQIPTFGYQLWVAFKDGVLMFTLYAFTSGALVSLVLLVLKLKNRKDKIAFGPYIALGFIVFYLAKTLVS